MRDYIKRPQAASGRPLSQYPEAGAGAPQLQSQPALRRCAEELGRGESPSKSQPVLTPARASGHLFWPLCAFGSALFWACHQDDRGPEPQALFPLVEVGRTGRTDRSILLWPSGPAGPEDVGAGWEEMVKAGDRAGAGPPASSKRERASQKL